MNLNFARFLSWRLRVRMMETRDRNCADLFKRPGTQNLSVLYVTVSNRVEIVLVSRHSGWSNCYETYR